jgi:hypothetical protein
MLDMILKTLLKWQPFRRLYFHFYPLPYEEIIQIALANEYRYGCDMFVPRKVLIELGAQAINESEGDNYVADMYRAKIDAYITKRRK